MRTHLKVISLLSLFLIGASAAQAVLLEPDGISRYVSVQSGGPQVWQYGTGVEPFSATLTSANDWASATQNSSITANTISISGSAYAYGTADIGSAANSKLAEGFTLTLQTPYSFITEYTNNNNSNVIAYLVGPSGDVFRQFLYGNGTWDSQGLLEPGQYHYAVNGGASAYPLYDSTSSSVSFSATFSLLPEPCSAGLLLLGGLLAARRRRDIA